MVSLMMLSLLIYVLPTAAAMVGAAPLGQYKNMTLQSPIMSARVYMPPEKGGRGKDSTADGSDRYYLGSRFEHGSMIGDMVFGGDREIYGRGLWRTPHDQVWPESGVGLASEFGCGDNGASCAGKGEITNGVLGYDDAKSGEPFLKIGVGVLIKGSCPECAGDEKGEYRFNSPYKFHRPPSWRVLSSPGPNEASFLSEESLGEYGYRIQKTTRLDGNILTVRSMLTNLGKKQFTTPWYSHHFFTGDTDPVGPGYSLDLGLSEYGLRSSTPQFEQPGLGKWSGDINDYANVTMAPDGSISINLKKVIPEGVRLKADFLDGSLQTLTDGSFTLHAPNGISVSEEIPELHTQSRNPFIYGYNVYAERGTLSPEPMLLLYLNPGETTFWTQHLKFSQKIRPTGGLQFLSMMASKAWQRTPLPELSSGFSFMVLAACLGLLVASYTRFAGSRRRFEYTSIPDHSAQQESGDVPLSVV